MINGAFNVAIYYDVNHGKNALNMQKKQKYPKSWLDKLNWICNKRGSHLRQSTHHKVHCRWQFLKHNK